MQSNDLANRGRDVNADELKDEDRTPCEIWTRVMGYHRPISQWNAGKQSEHAERRYLNQPSGDDNGPV